MFLVHATLGLSLNSNLFINPKIRYEKKRILLLIEIQGLVSGDYKIYILTFEIEKNGENNRYTPTPTFDTTYVFCQRKSCSVIGNKNSIYKLQQHHHLYQTDDHSVPVKRQ